MKHHSEKTKRLERRFRRIRQIHSAYLGRLLEAQIRTFAERDEIMANIKRAEARLLAAAYELVASDMADYAKGSE